MTELLLGQGSPRGLEPWGERMLAPDEVASMVQLHRLGWGTKRIAVALGCSRNTVKRYLAAGGWVAIRQSRRRRRLDELNDWLRERFRQHLGNCDVVRQDLLREHGVTGGTAVRVHLFVATLGYSRRPLSEPSGMSGNRPGSTAWKARFGTLVGYPRRWSSTIRGRWSITMMRPPARCVSTNACTHLRATGASGRGLAHRTEHAPRARACPRA